MSGNRVTFRWNGPPIGPAPIGYQLEGGVAPGQPMVALPTGLAAPIVTSPRRPARSSCASARSVPADRADDPTRSWPTSACRQRPRRRRCCRRSVSATPCTWRGRRPSRAARRASSSSTSAARWPRRSRCPTSNACRSPALRPGGHAGDAARGERRWQQRTHRSGAAPGAGGMCRSPRAAHQPARLRRRRHDRRGDGPAGIGQPGDERLVTVPGIGALPLGVRTIAGPLPTGTWSIGVQAIGPCGASAAVAQTHVVP